MPTTEASNDTLPRLNGTFKRITSAWALLLVPLMAILPYLPSLSYGFVYDDDVQVLRMPYIRPWHHVPGYFLRPIPGFSARYYRPIFFLWMRLNHFLFGIHPLGWHLSNLVLHAFASFLVFAVLRRYFQRPYSAAVGALIFALHPAHVETVAWVSGSTDALMTASLLASLWLWMRSLEAPSSLRRSASLACCALALMTKETGVILPALIFFHSLGRSSAESWLPKDRGGRTWFAMRETAPYLFVTALYLGVRFWVLRGVSGGVPEWITPREALLTIPPVVLFYLRHLLWPLNLSLCYDLSIVTRVDSHLFWIPSILLAAGAAAVSVWLGRTRDMRNLLSVVWLLLPLAPVLYIRAFAQDDFIHDRYLYLPVLGIAVAAGMLGEFLGKSKEGEKKPGLLLAALGAGFTVLALATAAQERPWKNNLLLYSNAVKVAPNNLLAKNNLAREYVPQGRFVEAGEMFKAIIEKRPEMWLANYNYGFVNYRTGDLALAENYFRRAIQINPNDPDEHVYLGATYLKQGRLAEASEQVREGIARKPDGTGYHFLLGIIELQLGNLEPARDQMLEELKYHPENSIVREEIQQLDKQLRSTPH